MDPTAPRILNVVSLVKPCTVVAAAAFFAMSAFSPYVAASAAVSSPAGLQITGLYMVSQSIGWATTEWGIARTTDGARRWSLTARVPGYPDPQHTPTCEAGSSSFFAEGHNRAWLALTCGDAAKITVWRTNNAGETWRSTVLSGYGTYIPAGSIKLDFVTPTMGWLVPESLGGVWGPPAASALFETVNSGKTWFEVSKAGTPGAQLGFASPRRWYAARDAPAYPYPGFAGFPLVTNNGGKTWAHPNVPIPPGYARSLIVTNTAGITGTASVSVPVTLFSPDPIGGYLFTTYTSTDGGIHWRHTKTFRGGSGKKYFSGFYINAKVGFAGDGSQGQYRTTDSGAHWTKLPKSFPIGAQWLTSRVAFAAGVSAGEIGETTNSGASWTYFEPFLV